MAVHVRVGDLYHTARNKPKALVQAELLRLVKQHLHSQADAQQRRARGGLLPNRLDQPQPRQTVHAVLERANARQHQLFRGQHIRRVTGQQRFGPKVGKRMADAQQVGQAVVNHCYLHT